MLKSFIKTYSPIIRILAFVAFCYGCQDRNKIYPDEKISNKGIPNVGNSCYINSVLQISARLYPDLFSQIEDPWGYYGLDIANKITSKDPQKYVTAEEAQKFYDALLNSYNQHHEDPKERLTPGTQYDAAPVLQFILEMGKVQKLEQYSNRVSSDSNTSSSPIISYTANKIDFLMIDFPFSDQGNEDETLSMDTLVINSLHENHTGGGSTRLSIQNLRGLTNGILPIWVNRVRRKSNPDPSSEYKITTPIMNPFKLNIASDYLIETGEEKYAGSLVGFIHHYNGCESIDYGHYIAYVKTPAGKWIRYSDEIVTELHEEPLSEAQAAYLYFYRAD